MEGSKKRLDLYLVEHGIAKSRSQAQVLIESHLVEVGGKVISKSSYEVPTPAPKITVKENPFARYVSRGGLKLESALDRTRLKVKDAVALDIGISTGGFSDCLIQSGAKMVFGVDVGTGQLAPSLERHPKLKHFENINARELTAAHLGPDAPPQGFDIIVIDVSFISLEHIFPRAAELLSPSGSILALVKPQFEAGPGWIGKGGIVKEEKAFEEVKKKIYTFVGNLHLRNFQLVVEDYFESGIPGTDGNQEFFILARFASDIKRV